jgi:hypothetical protein
MTPTFKEQNNPLLDNQEFIMSSFVSYLPEVVQ